MPEFTELLKSVQENGRLMREDAERRSREWDKKVAQLEQERKEREAKLEQERKEREERLEKEKKEHEAKLEQERQAREARWEKVLHFLDQMKHFKEVFHPFKNMTVYGAVAALRYNDHSDKVALKNGLFVLHASGEGVFKMEVPAVWKIFGESNQEKEEDSGKLDP